MSESVTIDERLRRFVATPADADWQDVLRRAGTTSASGDGRQGRRRWTRRRLVVAFVVVAIALALPTLALSGVLGSIFGISNGGKHVHEGPSLLHQLNGHLVSAGGIDVPIPDAAEPDTFVRLALRHGIGIYAARSKKDGSPCFFIGERQSLRGEPPNQLYLNGPGCDFPYGASYSLPERLMKLSVRQPGKKSEAAADKWLRTHPFPSPARPLYDMSGARQIKKRPWGLAVDLLLGVAANRVRSIQLLALADCHPVVTVPVINNVYIDPHPPAVAELFLVARDARGRVVWHSARSYMAVPKVRSPLDPKVPKDCGLG